MLKKFAALACAALVGTVLIVGLSGCSENKPAGGGAAPANTGAPADGKPADSKPADH